jgi:hypothetical protein
LASLEILPVRSRSEMKRFLNLPWSIYQGDPNWVPPLKPVQAKMLDPKRHPYWDRAQRELFLALRDGRPVGRIMAHVDHAYNEYHQDTMGAWGFFECRDDREAAAALFDAAEDYVRGLGMTYLRGPLNPSTNYELAFLLEGFDRPPVLMMSYNPPYYLRLAEECGFAKEKDLYAYIFEKPDHMNPSWNLDSVDQVARRSGLSLRFMKKKTLKTDIVELNRLYRECWSDNWGFVPMSEAEIEASAAELGFILDPSLAFFVERHGEPVAVCLVLPDMYQALKKINGSLNPVSLLKLLRWRKRLPGVRCLMLGVAKGQNMAGPVMLALNQLVRIIVTHPVYQYIEMSWTLEDNTAVNQLIENGGARLYKRYRVYRREITPGDPAVSGD